MKKKGLRFWLVGCGAGILVLLAVVFALKMNDSGRLPLDESVESYITTTDWRAFFAHAKGVKEDGPKAFQKNSGQNGGQQNTGTQPSGEGRRYSIRFFYENDRYEEFGTEAFSAVSELTEHFSGDLAYATHSLDSQSYSPNQEGKYERRLLWVTDQDELIELALLRTDVLEETMLSAELSWQINALTRVAAKVDHVTGDSLYVKEISGVPADPEQVYQVMWDCGGGRFTKPDEIEGFAPNDDITLWLLEENNDLMKNAAVFNVKMEKQG